MCEGRRRTHATLLPHPVSWWGSVIQNGRLTCEIRQPLRRPRVSFCGILAWVSQVPPGSMRHAAGQLHLGGRSITHEYLEWQGRRACRGTVNPSLFSQARPEIDLVLDDSPPCVSAGDAKSQRTAPIRGKRQYPLTSRGIVLSVECPHNDHARRGGRILHRRPP